MSRLDLLGVLATCCVLAAHEAQAETTGAVEAAAGLLIEKPCADARVAVAGASAIERLLACSGAADALQLLGQCKIEPNRPVRIRVMTEVRNPLGGEMFGLFDIKHDIVLVTRLTNIASLVRDTPYAELSDREFYMSLIVHEVVHGVMHHRYKRRPASHAGYEYPAYALQIEALPPAIREKFLRSFDRAAMRSDFLFNDAVLFFDPYFFAARAYEHFRASPGGCAHLAALLEGEVPFIATMPLR